MRKKEKHGLAHDPMYKVWVNLRQRCLNPQTPYYKNYGGRGIKLCERWANSFRAFLQDVGRRPSPKHTLERKNNDGNYEPGNVRWATRKEQANNMRKTHWLTFQGRRQSLSAWAEELGLVPSTLQYRLNQGGMSVEQALSVPRRQGRRPKAK